MRRTSERFPRSAARQGPCPSPPCKRRPITESSVAAPACLQVEPSGPQQKIGYPSSLVAGWGTGLALRRSPVSGCRTRLRRLGHPGPMLRGIHAPLSDACLATLGPPYQRSLCSLVPPPPPLSPPSSGHVPTPVRWPQAAIVLSLPICPSASVGVRAAVWAAPPDPQALLRRFGWGCPYG